jgi:peptidoglycan L-alanyl-D-glutamate endopeptidase CwlK
MLTDRDRRRLSTVDPRLAAVVEDVAGRLPIMVICGHRTQAEQDDVVRRGLSKTLWPRSKHNSMPSLAVDLAPLKGRTIDWNDTPAFVALGKLMRQAAAARGVAIRWGGDWDRDGLTRADGDRDERFIDLPHFEIVEG